jgi:ribosome biogenesis protein MAK21
MLTEPEQTIESISADTAGDSTSDAVARKDDGRYDGKKREPQFANAENSCLWELVSF